MQSTDRRYTTTAAEKLPIWMAALLASQCEAKGNGCARRVAWRYVAGRAVYTNSGADTEVILPFGVPVHHGESVIVTWLPGETGYTVELETDRVAA